MKKFIVALLIVILLFVIVSCVPNSVVSDGISQTVPEEKQVQMYIDIDDSYHGYYCLMSGGTIEYDEEYETCTIFMDDPALLAFKVSEENYPGGIGTVSGEDIEYLKDLINDFKTNNSLDTPTNNLLNELLYRLDLIAVTEGAST